ncbi:hypothetical protein L873DRAFT_1793240 [Choiromyces venosus 120613-1]|uniref:Uncharacterized protein n=1 Tax=Choiromyces venosus 120613-1 TaxID=1336337 RepID=A0A3N4JBZ0_9PEZI|nr:hypothetical protein L873DRAFT_1793240 [Choiromyces venosus 120613-1]
MFFSRHFTVAGIITLILAFINSRRRNPRRPPTPPARLRIHTRLHLRHRNRNFDFFFDERPLPGIPHLNHRNRALHLIPIPADAGLFFQGPRPVEILPDEPALHVLPEPALPPSDQEAPLSLTEPAPPPQVHPPANGGPGLQDRPWRFGWEYWEPYGTGRP